MRQRQQQGFTYLGLLILLTVLGLVGAAGLKMGTLMQRAANEEELLEIGAQFSEALRSYAAATPPGQPTQPPSLRELLKDPRTPNPRRHLRKIFVDPVTGKAEWGIVYLGDKVGVLGVYSLSNARPLKIANFDIRFQNMDNRERISDWKFLMAGGDGVAPAVLTPPNSMVGAPSLFAPGTAPTLGGKNPDAAAGAAAPGKGDGAVAGTAKPGDAAAQAPAPAPEEGAPEPKADDSAPMEPPAEEQKEKEEPPETEPVKDESTEPPKPVAPPPAAVGAPHKR